MLTIKPTGAVLGATARRIDLAQPMAGYVFDPEFPRPARALAAAGTA